MNLYDIYNRVYLKMLEFFPQKKTERIYHYTSEDVLWKFLEPDNDFYCTYCRALSDPTEFEMGMFVCTRMWREYCDGNEDKFLSPLKYAYAMSGNGDKNLLPWIMSFSKAKDKTSQWENYTNRNSGGFSIGFNADKIKAHLSENNNQSHDSWVLITLLPCLYSGFDDQDKINAMLDFVLNKVVIDLRYLLDERLRADNNEQIARALLYLLMASIIKHSDFKGEEEWRLIVQPLELSKLVKLPKDVNAVAMIGGKPRMRSGLFGNERHMISGLIDEIVVSPHGPSDVLRDRAQMFLALRGINTSIVVNSESPYRGSSKQ